MKKQTAGRNALGEFAPKFAELNDDVLFGEVWSREDKLSARDRSLVTVAALIGSGVLDSSQICLQGKRLSRKRSNVRINRLVVLLSVCNDRNFRMRLCR